MARRPTKSSGSSKTKSASAKRAAPAKRSATTARSKPATHATSARAASSGRAAAGRTAASRSTAKASAASKPRASQATPAKQKDLGDLFLETLKDIYHAEKQILRALPKMAKGARAPELRQAFETHARQTEGHVARLEKIFAMSGKRPQAKTCHAIMGLVEEANEVLKEFKGSDALDAGLLAAAQAVEHYEISRYGTLRSWAAQHGMQDVARLLDETLGEEKKTDQLLTQIAERNVNREAA